MARMAPSTLRRLMARSYTSCIVASTLEGGPGRDTSIGGRKQRQGCVQGRLLPNNYGTRPNWQVHKTNQKTTPHLPLAQRVPHQVSHLVLHPTKHSPVLLHKGNKDVPHTVRGDALLQMQPPLHPAHTRGRADTEHRHGVTHTHAHTTLPPNHAHLHKVNGEPCGAKGKAVAVQEKGLQKWGWAKALHQGSLVYQAPLRGDPDLNNYLDLAVLRQNWAEGQQIRTQNVGHQL